MHLAYFDESGDSGALPQSPTKWFVLACVLVPQENWMQALDTLVDKRRALKTKYGIPSRAELKATHLKKGQGPLQALNWSIAQRMKLYKELLRFVQSELSFTRVFAIAIDKAKAAGRGAEPRETAWTYALQRLHSHCDDSAVQDYAMVFPDEGHGLFIRQLMRKMRRFHRVPKHWGSGYIEFKTERIVEDPNDRRSEDSFLIQVADWCAYAAHRSKYCAPVTGVPPDLWDVLDTVLHPKVNSVRGGPPGMVVWP